MSNILLQLRRNLPLTLSVGGILLLAIFLLTHFESSSPSSSNPSVASSSTFQPEPTSPPAWHQDQFTRFPDTAATTKPVSSPEASPAVQAPPAQPVPQTSGGVLGNISPSVIRMIQGTGGGGVLPVVMAEPPEGVVFTEAQQAIIDKMTDDFVAAVGGAGQDPNDPAYKKRWKEAQWLADQQYRAYFGNQAFAEMQKRAYLQTVQSSNSGQNGTSR